jgi:hypothetical protein
MKNLLLTQSNALVFSFFYLATLFAVNSFYPQHFLTTFLALFLVTLSLYVWCPEKLYSQYSSARMGGMLVVLFGGLSLYHLSSMFASGYQAVFEGVSLLWRFPLIAAGVHISFLYILYLSQSESREGAIDIEGVAWEVTYYNLEEQATICLGKEMDYGAAQKAMGLAISNGFDPIAKARVSEGSINMYFKTRLQKEDV